MSDPEVSAAQGREALVSAVLARTLAAEAQRDPNEAQERVNNEEKKAFRRLLSAGIQRNNDARIAVESIKTLLKLANNILDHPDEPKYQQFKPTNAMIKRTLVDPKGTMEFAVALGFRADVQNFQPLYVFKPTPKNMSSLRNGAVCLQEVIDREEVSQDRIKRNRMSEKEAQAKQRELVRLAYEEDRREKQLRDELERQRREAVAQAQAQAALNAARAEAEDDPQRVYGPRTTSIPGSLDGPPPYSATLSLTGAAEHGTDEAAIDYNDDGDEDDDDGENEDEGNAAGVRIVAQ